MQVGNRKLIVVGDRVLVRSDEGDVVTGAGLILPASVADRDAVQAGRVVEVGPGHVLGPSGLDFEEEWKRGRAEPRFLSMQAEVGDVAIFHRKAAVEVSVAAEKLYVVPHHAILVLLRDDDAGAKPRAQPVN